MSYSELFYAISDKLLIIPFILVLLGSIILSIRMRFIQIRMIPRMIKMLTGSIKQQTIADNQAISPLKALFTAMSTTIGIGNIGGPIIAMGLGGPGALAGFILATLFGCATTFVEVSLALAYRKRLPDGKILGGPMFYLSEGLGPFFGKLYAYSGFILLVAWSSAQSNTFAVLIAPYGIPQYVTGILLAISVTFILIGGIKRISDLNEKLVPLMFLLYCSAAGWILFVNIAEVPSALALIFNSFFSLNGAGGALAGLGFFQAIRHGLARALQANEAGVGTATFPHSMSEAKDPIQQGILAMVSVYSNGILCLLTGLVIITSGVWKDPSIPFNITMLSKVMEMHFSSFGPIILAACAFLFAFGTILGNAYNGCQCFLYTTNNRFLHAYYFLVALLVFGGCIMSVQFVWTIIDFFILPVVVPHMIGIVYLSYKRPEIFNPQLTPVGI